MIWTFLAGAAKLLLAEVVILYAIIVLAILQSEGLHYELRFDSSDPARSSGRLLIWLGVRIGDPILRVLKAGLDALEDASADIGEWVLHRRNL